MKKTAAVVSLALFCSLTGSAMSDERASCNFNPRFPRENIIWQNVGIESLEFAELMYNARTEIEAAKNDMELSFDTAKKMQTDNKTIYIMTGTLIANFGQPPRHKFELQVTETKTNDIGHIHVSLTWAIYP